MAKASEASPECPTSASAMLQHVDELLSPMGLNSPPPASPTDFSGTLERQPARCLLKVCRQLTDAVFSELRMHSSACQATTRRREAKSPLDVASLRKQVHQLLPGAAQSVSVCSSRRMSSAILREQPTSSLLVGIALCVVDLMSLAVEEQAVPQADAAVSSPVTEKVVFMDDFEKVLPTERDPSFTDDVSILECSSKRRRSERACAPAASARRAMTALDDRFAALSSRLYRTTSDDDADAPLEAVALSVARPLVAALVEMIRSDNVPEEVKDSIGAARDELMDRHDVDIAPPPQKPGRMSMMLPQLLQDEPLSMLHADEASRCTSRRHSPVQQLQPSALEEDGEELPPLVAASPPFSIPPPLPQFSRSIGEIVQKCVASKKALGSSPPRSPLQSTSSHQFSFESSTPVHTASSRSPTSVGATAPKVLGGMKTPSTAPKRQPEIPTYMLTKKRAPAGGRRSSLASVVPPHDLIMLETKDRTSGLRDSYYRVTPSSSESSLQQPPPPQLVLSSSALATPPVKPRDFAEMTMPLEDRILFADDAD